MIFTGQSSNISLSVLLKKTNSIYINFKCDFKTEIVITTLPEIVIWHEKDISFDLPEEL